ncbi:MAG: type II toxin-antitoxin system RelE/ParE family toxin [Saprospiraceae bacterium]|nr:type II toxin-antitoxin system RelE/ParE family toxin [Saprospiraceae bacterium]
MKIFFTKNAKRNFENIQIYLEINWGIKAKDKFAFKVYHSLELLKQNPKLGTREHESKSLYGLLIHKHIKIFYRIKNDRISILSLFDVRQNPEARPT